MKNYVMIGLVLALLLAASGCSKAPAKEVTLIWQDQNGKELYRTNVARDTLEEQGRVPYYELFGGEVPLMESSQDLDYFFERWEVDEEKSDVNTKVFYPTFFSYFKRYQLTWLDTDGSVLEVTTGLSGRDALFYGPSVLPKAENYVWTPEPSVITGDATYQAQIVAN